jgi:hypothetical protein
VRDIEEACLPHPLAWLVGFALMWVVIGNLGVLPKGILYFAVPLSLLEAFLAVIIIKKFSAIPIRL